MNKYLQAQSIKRGYLTRNIITNGDFSNGATGWNPILACNISGGTCNFTGDGYLNKIFTGLPNGVQIDVSFDVIGTGSIAFNGGIADFTQTTSFPVTTGRYSKRLFSITVNANKNLYFHRTSGIFSIDNIVIRRVI